MLRSVEASVTCSSGPVHVAPSSVEWLETVPQDSIAGAPDDEVALRGLISAVVERGG